MIMRGKCYTGLLRRVLWKADGSLRAIDGDSLARRDALYRAGHAYHRRNAVLVGMILLTKQQTTRYS